MISRIIGTLRKLVPARFFTSQGTNDRWALLTYDDLHAQSWMQTLDQLSALDQLRESVVCYESPELPQGLERFAFGDCPIKIWAAVQSNGAAIVSGVPIAERQVLYVSRCHPPITEMIPWHKSDLIVELKSRREPGRGYPGVVFELF